MVQKLLKVGSSTAVTIPKESLKELGLKAGDKIRVRVDKKRRIVSIVPEAREKKLSKQDERIAKLTMSFINRYRSDLEALSRK